MAVTQKSRDFMVNNPRLKLPNNYQEYPGKMDHASGLAFRVGFNPESAKQT